MGGGILLTTLQTQCLLAFLGLYPHTAIDGIWGEKSRKALKDFQARHGLTADGPRGKQSSDALRKAVMEEERNFWSGVRYFTREEFRCRCGGKDCGGFPEEPSEKLVSLADDIRAHFGRPAHATSGLRCPKHNARCSGVANSRHLTGRALDFYIEDISGPALLTYVQSDPRTRYAYQIPGTDCVHMDVE